MLLMGTGKAREVLLIALAVMVCVAIVGMGKNVVVLQGHANFAFASNEAFIQYCGVNGSVSIATGASGYDDSYLLSAGGAFSGQQQEDAYSLSRALTLAGGGSVHALTHAYGSGAAAAASGGTVTSSGGTTIDLSFNGSYASITETIDFGNLGSDPPGINVRMAIDAESGWIKAVYDDDDAQVQRLASTFGLSLAEATSLYEGGVVGLIGGLSQFGYSAAQVVELALTQGLEYLRGVLSMLRSPYVAGPIDQAAAKYNVSWRQAQGLYGEFGETVFCHALSVADTYKTFLANLKGWGVSVWAGSIINRATVLSGGVITVAFRLFHPTTQEQFHDPQLRPYVTVARILPDGRLEGIAGYFSYIQCSLEQATGTYYSQINTAPGENEKLAPGTYCAFVVTRNPATDLFSKVRATFVVT